MWDGQDGRKRKKTAVRGTGPPRPDQANPPRPAPGLSFFFGRLGRLWKRGDEGRATSAWWVGLLVAGGLSDGEERGRRPERSP